MAVSTSSPKRRPFPIVFIVDVSGSMADDGKIEVLNDAMRVAIDGLAAESDPDVELYLAVLTYSDEAHVAQRLAPLLRGSFTPLVAGGRSNLGTALDTLVELIDGPDYPETAHHPALVLVSDGHPTDEFLPALERARTVRRFDAATRVAVRIGNDAHDEHLALFAKGSLGVLSAPDIMTVPQVLVRVTQAVESTIAAHSSSQTRRA